MNFRRSSARKASVPFSPRSTGGCRPAIVLSISVVFSTSLPGSLPQASLAADPASPIQVQRTGRAPSSHVGSAMAVLATLEQAQVLPPEGSPDANHVIKSVIQFQSVFAKSADTSVQDFVRGAVVRAYGGEAAELLTTFRSGGWTPEVLEALADAELHAPAEALRSLTDGLGRFNVTVEDFQRFMRLIRDGRQALASRGQSFREVYRAHRKTMPGAAVHE